MKRRAKTKKPQLPWWKRGGRVRKWIDTFKAVIQILNIISTAIKIVLRFW